MSLSVGEQAAVVLTERAGDEIKSLFESQGCAGAMLRVFVHGGGCSGLQYGMMIAEEMEEGDIKFEQHGVSVLVDEDSIEYLRGSTIDWVEDEVMGSGFKIDNPNAVRGCGCGSSFSTEEGASGGGCGSGGCCSR
jgi:iron-sulfur cluster assembly protein